MTTLYASLEESGVEHYHRNAQCPKLTPYGSVVSVESPEGTLNPTQNQPLPTSWLGSSGSDFKSTALIPCIECCGVSTEP